MMKESYFRGENLSERSRKNLFILDAIRRRGPISKTDISSLIGLNVVTVSNYVDEFLRQKIVFEKEFDVSKGGRRPLLLDLNTSAGYAVGVGVNLLGTIGVVTDLSGKILHKVRNGKSGSGSRDVVDSILTITAELLDEAKGCRQKIKGIGIGIGGIVDAAREKCAGRKRSRTGIIIWTLPSPEDILEREFRLPPSLERCDVACFGEQWLALDSDTRTCVYGLRRGGG
jgi:predicted transcriptional regulator